MGFINKVKGLFVSENIMYSSKICSDCQEGERFFKEHGIDIEIKKIEEEKYRDELKRKYGKVLVPTIILKGEKFIGFDMNKEAIKKKLNIG